MWKFIRNSSALGLSGALVSASVFALALLSSSMVSAQTCPFDNGGSTLENDGLVLTRYALGLRGATMVANTSFAVGDASTIEANIACPACGLRVTDDRDGLGNPIFTATDATIISRKLAGFGGTALTNGLALGSGTRNTTTAVQSFLLAGCGASGGTVTNVTAGTGLIGGSITASGTIAADTTYLQRRVSNACGTGSFITGIAADGTPTCAAPPASGGSGTVTSVGTGLGLVATGPNIVSGAIVSNGLMELAYGFILPQGCTTGQVPKSNGSGVWNCAADNAGSGVTNAFVQGGNAFGVPAVLGTTDNQPLTVGIGSGHGLRVIPSNVTTRPNIILGSISNSISTTASGATIGGGTSNVANGTFATISGGATNAAGSSWATVAGGASNSASGNFSFAAGRQAKAESEGSFVWADSTPLNYRGGFLGGPTIANSFNVRATGGVNFLTAVDAAGNQTKGMNITASGNVFVDELNVAGASSAASLNVSGVSNTQSLSIGASGSVITGLQSGRASIPAPGTSVVGSNDPTSCKSRVPNRLTCEVDVTITFPLAFPVGTNPRVIASVNATGVVVNPFTDFPVPLSVMVLNANNASATFRVTQNYFDGNISVDTSGGGRPLSTSSLLNKVGWTGAYAIDWLAIAQ
jgi:hypothetical protein